MFFGAGAPTDGTSSPLLPLLQEPTGGRLVLLLKCTDFGCRIGGRKRFTLSEGRRRRPLARRRADPQNGCSGMPDSSTRRCKPEARSSEQPLVYLSPRDLAVRWRCSRSTVDRIVEREGLTRLCLGEGQNGIIRYFLAEVEELEESRLLKSQTVS